MQIEPARNMGNKSFQILQQGGSFRVQGVTSRGVFLESDSGWILFLSGEGYRGPLTMNVPDLQQIRGKFSKGVIGQFNGKVLSFPESGVGVELTEAEVWQVDLFELGGTSFQRKAMEMIRLAEHPVVRYLRGGDESALPGNPVLLGAIRKIPELIGQGDLEEAVIQACEIMGLGSGLTPEGDDFLIGLIFCLRIANNDSGARVKNSSVIDEIVTLAAKRTTRLSANLLSCAAEGQVDERISQVVEGFHQDAAEFNLAVENLMGWGNTSGGMVFAGIVAGVLSCED